MKKLSYILLLLISVWLGGGEDSSDALPYGYIETTQEGTSTMVMKGYENYADGFSVFKADGFDKPFYLKEKKFVGNAWRFVPGVDGKLSAMTEVPADQVWQETIEVVSGKNYWARCKSATKYSFLKVRIAYIEGNNVGIEYIAAGTKDRDLSENVNANVATDRVSVTNYEMPRLNAANYYVDHYVTVSNVKVLNYGLEWNPTMKHSTWVAFNFDEITCKEGAERGKNFFVDPELPVEMQVTNDQHKNDGFDRGHLCGSADRLYTQEANDQTFYFSNISPMIPSFNGQYWGALENQIRKWGRAIPTTYDKVYVAKGGTLNELLKDFTATKKGGDGKLPSTDENGLTIHGLPCPKYYFMAILSQKGDIWHAIGFWMEHQEYLSGSPSVNELKKCAVSIDELEEKTGLDFFCNLPDVIEEEVESTYNENDWAW